MYLYETFSAPCAGIPICRFVCPCMLERVLVEVGIRKTRVRKQVDAQTRACLSVSYFLLVQSRSHRGHLDLVRQT